MEILNSDAMGKLVLRFSLGGLMLFHGVAKLTHAGTLDFIGGLLTANGLPQQLVWAVYIGEVLAPLMIIFGVYVRVGGLLVVTNMLFAIGLAHRGDLLSLGSHGGWALELQGFYLFGGLALLLLGSGRIAVKPD